MTLTPSLALFLGAIVLGLGMGIGWTTGAWLVGLVLKRIPA